MFDCYGHQSTQYTAWSGSTNETVPVDIKFELELIDNYLSNVDSMDTSSKINVLF